ncbi:MAG: YihY family inner membrane protein, partial [Succinivibrionaceae bacterium]|nr:YihY family inner membrane protein [Succinivibrionaceae bacterium]
MFKFLKTAKVKINQNKFISSIALFSRTIYGRYVGDRITVEAGHLAYVTVLSLVPLVTVLFSILSMLPIFESIKDSMKTFVFNNFVPTSSDVIQQYMDQFSQNASNTTLIGA